MNDIAIFDLVMKGGALGLVAWAWFQAPAIAEKLRLTIQTQTDKAEVAIKEQTAKFEAAIQAQAHEFSVSMRAQAAEFAGIIREQRTEFRQELAEFRQELRLLRDSIDRQSDVVESFKSDHKAVV